MSWQYYHANVKITVGTTDYTIPTGYLNLKNEPVSRAGSFAIELFNSSYIQSVDGWRVKAEFTWPELSNSVDDNIRIMLDELLDLQFCTVDFDPLDEFPSEDRTLQFVLLTAPEALQANFNYGARNRRSAFTLESRSLFSTPLEWITL